MAQQFTTVEVYIVVDSDGNTATGTDAGNARENFETEVQELNECEGFRIVRVRVRVPLPEVAVVEMEAEAPEFEPPTAE